MTNSRKDSQSSPNKKSRARVACGTGLALIALAACSSSSPSTSAPFQVQGTYAATQAAASVGLSSITFVANQRYFGYGNGCAPAADGCRHQGAYALDSANGTLSLTDDATKATVSFPIHSVATSTAQPGLGTAHIGVLDLVTGADGGLVNGGTGGDDASADGGGDDASSTLLSGDDDDDDDAGSLLGGAGSLLVGDGGVSLLPGVPVATGVAISDAVFNQLVDTSGNALLSCASPDTADDDCGAQDSEPMDDDSSTDGLMTASLHTTAVTGASPHCACVSLASTKQRGYSASQCKNVHKVFRECLTDAGGAYQTCVSDAQRKLVIELASIVAGNLLAAQPCVGSHLAAILTSGCLLSDDVIKCMLDVGSSGIDVYAATTEFKNCAEGLGTKPEELGKYANGLKKNLYIALALAAAHTTAYVLTYSQCSSSLESDSNACEPIACNPAKAICYDATGCPTVAQTHSTTHITGLVDRFAISHGRATDSMGNNIACASATIYGFGGGETCIASQ